MPKRALLSDAAIAALRRRHAKQMRWCEIARDLNISGSNMSRLLARSRGVGAEVASRLAEYCALPIGDIFSSID